MAEVLEDVSVLIGIIGYDAEGLKKAIAGAL